MEIASDYQKQLFSFSKIFYILNNKMFNFENQQQNYQNVP